jgi:hypothetical protein
MGKNITYVCDRMPVGTSFTVLIAPVTRARSTLAS